MNRLKDLILGAPFPSHRGAEERLSNGRALAIFASDPISSNAYATEAILLALVPLGAASAGLVLPISVAIALLVGVVVSSYNQTIRHYPRGGGAYFVALDNLGRRPALIAAAALLLDYLLTAAVSVSAGVRALSSAFPETDQHRVAIGLAILLLMTLINLRGLRESGAIFSVPTYAFVLAVFSVILIGLWRLAFGDPFPAGPPPGEALSSAPLAGDGIFGLAYAWIVLRAFAAGCTALTGIEAISNGVEAFREPQARNAIKTMRMMALLAMGLFVGIGFLANRLHLQVGGSESLLSQLTAAIVGRGPLYYAVQFTTMMVLFLAANAAFQGFPRLGATLARDRVMPSWLAHQGQRLVLSSGIITLSLLAALLLVVADGDEMRLLPLYAIGVFVGFVLSQAGMARFWRRMGAIGPGEVLTTDMTSAPFERGWRTRLWLSWLGALVTGLVLAVLVATKFRAGAWLVLASIPLLLLLFAAIERHYLAVRSTLRLRGLEAADLTEFAGIAIVPVADIHRGSLRAIRFATRFAPDVRVVSVLTGEDHGAERSSARLVERWARWEAAMKPARLITLESPYREIIGPLMAYIDEVHRLECPDRLLAVVVPEVLSAGRMTRLLHNHTAAFLRHALREHPKVVVIEVPIHVGAEPARP